MNVTKFTVLAMGSNNGNFMMREEVIDTATNSLFADCDSIMSIKQAYEAFWNTPNSVERVRVHKITAV